MDYGDPRLPNRFWDKVYPCPITGCWLWGGSVDVHGYARYYSKGLPKQGYAACYKSLVGPVPEGLELDHLCRVRCCVNPEHLQPVTHVRRALKVRYEVPKTHCKYGHEFSEENTRWRKDGGRDCK